MEKLEISTSKKEYLQMFVLLLGSKISLILQPCFSEVQGEDTANAHHTRDSPIEKLSWKT